MKKCQAQADSPSFTVVTDLTEVPKPKTWSGWVLIRVVEFGLKRSEIFTRQGHSGSAVTLPRILGIECVGVVEASPDSPLKPGQKVAAIKGGMGRAYRGSYAEHTSAPTTRSAAKKQALIAKGADHVVIDNGSILV